MNWEQQLQPPLPMERELRCAYLALIEQRFGLHLSDHQARHLEEVATRLLPGTGCSNPLELYGALTAGGRLDLLEALAAGLTVGETHFFRIRPQIEALRKVVLPDLIGKRASRRRLRLWSAGCSTGEEPYTLAILICQQSMARDLWDVGILATDISPQALEVGRRGIYDEWSFRETPEEVRRGYFTPERSQWRIVEPVRKMVRFAHFNLLDDTFPPRELMGFALDLILCRNVTIYFGAETAQQLYRRFADTLAPGGWLVLGPSDAPPSQPGFLEPVYLPGAVLWRRSPVPRRHEPPSFPWTPSHDLSQPRNSTPATARPEAEGSRAHHPAGANRREGKSARVSPEPPLSPPSALDRMWALAHAGDHAEARSQAARLARLRPLDAEVYLFLGMLDLDQGNDGLALGSLRRAAFLAPNLALAHFGLGRAYLHLQDEARAESALLQARGLLASVADDHPVAGGGGIQTGELRYAVDVLLAGLSGARSGDRKGVGSGR